MSILIKGMAMPKNCGECPFGKYESCQINLIIYGHDSANCPLVEAPPHGTWVLKTFCDEYGEYQLYECNLCGAVTAQRKSKNYCHNCGAKMESEE